MSQSFQGAEPKVVSNKNKYKENYGIIPEEEDDKGAALNIMYDKRVFRGNTHNMNILKQNLTPVQKEDLRIKAEREKKKVEMIKQQLIEFKKSKNKTSPYDLRPGPPARIEVDLTYFLTEQGKQRPEEIEVKIQTDDFQPKPPTPPYVPKKSGIDKITQIEDYDLFDYDREVQPILNVLLTKTVEQAILEVEEETELDEIRKFKTECYVRKQNERDDWEKEVKKEIARIKQKNKALKNARIKREQQIKTMHKLQCLNVAKAYLKNTYVNSLQFLAENNYWRNKFQDQLQVVYKEWLYKKIDEEFQKGTKSGQFQDGVVDVQIDEISKAKDPIKKAIEFNIQRKEKVRQIESNQSRTVHYLFNPGVPSKITPFARKYVRLLDGTLSEFENEEREKFQTYIEALENETLQDDEVNPVIFEDMPFFTCELTSLNRISFSVADDPFYKSTRAKYYPELVVMNIKGKILTTVNPDNRKSDKYGIEYLDDFREPQLKINDDRKIRLVLSQMKKPGRMILLTVKTFDLRRQPPKEGEFDRAWFRLVNEDTNQSIDYTKIKSIEKPDGFDEDAPFDEENQDEPRPTITYVAGRLFLDRNGRWVYEAYNHCFTSDRFPNLNEIVGEIYQRSEEEVKYYADEVQRAKDKVAANEEERRQAAKAAAAKKKGGKNAKKDIKEEEEEKKEEKKEIAVKKDLDLFLPNEFALALQEKIPRPFVFGPVELLQLDSPNFNGNLIRDHIESVLHNQPYMTENICIHGLKVTIKKKTLKRASTIVKHSRFLRNLEVFPIFPPEPEPVLPIEEGEGNQEDQEEDDD